MKKPAHPRHGWISLGEDMSRCTLKNCNVSFSSVKNKEQRPNTMHHKTCPKQIPYTARLALNRFQAQQDLP